MLQPGSQSKLLISTQRRLGASTTPIYEKLLDVPAFRETDDYFGRLVAAGASGRGRVNARHKAEYEIAPAGELDSRRLGGS